MSLYLVHGKDLLFNVALEKPILKKIQKINVFNNPFYFSSVAFLSQDPGTIMLKIKTDQNASSFFPVSHTGTRTGIVLGTALSPSQTERKRSKCIPDDILSQNLIFCCK